MWYPKKTTKDPVHSYVDPPYTSETGERIRARERLAQNFPRPTLVHFHVATSGQAGSCPGKRHILFRLDGKEQEMIGVESSGY